MDFVEVMKWKTHKVQSPSLSEKRFSDTFSTPWENHLTTIRFIRTREKDDLFTAQHRILPSFPPDKKSSKPELKSLTFWHLFSKEEKSDSLVEQE
jgi:hypothetical protein